MQERQILCVAKTKFICCKDQIYMLQRQNIYVIERKYVCHEDKNMSYKDKFICHTDKIYML